MEAAPVEDEEMEATTTSEEAELPLQEQAMLQKAVEHMHVTSGHPSNRAMARAVLLIGGSVAAVKACLEHRCSTGRRLREPKPTSAATFRDKCKIGDCVAIGLFTLRTPRATLRPSSMLRTWLRGFRLLPLARANTHELCSKPFLVFGVVGLDYRRRFFRTEAESLTRSSRRSWRL